MKTILCYVIKIKNLDWITIDGELCAGVEGKAELLTKLLKDRFCSLSKDVKDKIASDNADNIRAWSKKH